MEQQLNLQGFLAMVQSGQLDDQQIDQYLELLKRYVYQPSQLLNANPLEVREIADKLFGRRLAQNEIEQTEKFYEKCDKEQILAKLVLEFNSLVDDQRKEMDNAKILETNIKILIKTDGTSNFDYQSSISDLKLEKESADKMIAQKGLEMSEKFQEKCDAEEVVKGLMEEFNNLVDEESRLMQEHTNLMEALQWRS